MLKARLYLLFFLGISMSCLAAAEEVTLAWDPNNPAETVAGYRLYQDLNTQGQGVVGTVAAPATTLFLPSVSGCHTWNVTAFDQAGYESSYSNTVYWCENWGSIERQTYEEIQFAKAQEQAGRFHPRGRYIDIQGRYMLTRRLPGTRAVIITLPAY
ncbi:hypothetical protein DESUT3_21140 [Desulfuromonas versatilis]|uniref:Fibronectin type-III domain-containing protein n=1 Tax=Desulfuromonas versatilis TaxID=2802975 RepID=A0ABM8HPW7_9BACT|nr:hypothetical protein [Desulfuromonas versatilis]BCR05045.1 hypothetical protein DESUT3_21140 [Desulfuromonas versatilis]